MPPRKRPTSSSTSSATKKQSSQQPSKYGIQHFFERHTQNSQIPKNPRPSPPPKPSSDVVEPETLKDAVHSEANGADVPGSGSASEKAGEGTTECLSEVSPEITKSGLPKGFKFSPGMLIKQSQDDGGEAVTWKISPVNERLHLVSKQMPEVVKVLAESSRLNSMYMHQCSQTKNAMASGTSSFRASKGGLKRIRPAQKSKENGKASDDVSSGSGGQQSPFRTPPSLPYCHYKPDNGSLCTAACGGELHFGQHKKALLELLDQVEDVISVEEPVKSGIETCSSKFSDGDILNPSLVSHPVSRVSADLLKLENAAHFNQIFLVLEVAENCKSADLFPCKVLRLLNELSGEERAVCLRDEWSYSGIAPGDTVKVIGQFDDEGRCYVNRENNFLIVHPDLLLSGTRVASSFSCPRRSVLDERLRSSEHSTIALTGTLLHQIFQAGLVKEGLTKEFLNEYAGIILQKNIESLYACGVSEKDMLNTLMEAIPSIIDWIFRFKNSEHLEAPTVDFGSEDGMKKVRISEVIDIEEMSWAPKYGLKGMIDASIKLEVEDGTGVMEKIVPLEFKSGKGPNGQSSMEHCAQVILYTLLMSERYLKPIDSGLLFYLLSDYTKGISVRRSDLIGLIMRRNELAIDIVKASTAQQLPPMLRSPSVCKGCRHLDVCCLYHKAHGGNVESSGLSNLFDACTKHLTAAHANFLRHWDQLIDLEAKEAELRKKVIWQSRSLSQDHMTTSLSLLVLNASQSCKPSKDNRYTYHFVRQDLPAIDVEAPDNNTSSTINSSRDNLACALTIGDYVILGSESGQQMIASGIVTDISCFHIAVSFSKKLRLPRSSPSSEASDLLKEVWRIDKDESMTSFAVMRFNLMQLFLQETQSFHLRKLIVDLEAPRFDSGCIFSQDPAVSYVWSEEKLNEDQRRAILKILTARDYALILGMPGTGKTSTMVHAVKALLMRGASILLTSYTNSAVDNLLKKLKDQGIDFVRIGRHEVVHEEIRDRCFPVASGTKSTDEIKLRLNEVKVVAVTCLGITSPLLVNKKFDVCIMDEAGQITLPVSLGPLMYASVFVLVGDHYQLPPLVQSTEAQENGLGVSLFCRLSEAHPQAISALQSQYRMCDGIMQLSNALIYGDRLHCGSSEVANAKLGISKLDPCSSWLEEVLSPNRPVIFLDTDLLQAYEEKDGRTLNNPVEANIITQVVEELLGSGIMGEDIGIITPYNSQASLIRKFLSAFPVEIHTIDKYQGRDKDCVLISFVRSSEKITHYSSSLLGDWHRINVALTRAKKKLIMVGSCKTLSKLPLLKLLIEKVNKQSGVLIMSKDDISNTACLKRCQMKIE